MNHSEIFTTKAALYERSRPSYPDELLTFMKHEFHLGERTVVADIGAGTGKFTEKLLDLGCKVIAVEPNRAMADRLRDSLLCRQLEVSERPGEQTEIDDQSVDVIVAAQSFHWLDWYQFREECRRILKPRGSVCLIWNVKDETALINRRIDDIFRTYCPDYVGSSNGVTRDMETIKQFFEGEFELYENVNNLNYNQQRFIERQLSSSYALEEGDVDFEAFKAALIAVYEAFAEDGAVNVPNTVRCYYGHL